MSKRILSMLLAIVMVVGMMHGMSITANAAPSVSTSNNGTVLTISGTGEINQSTFEDLDYWEKLDVTSIVIESGITSIAGANNRWKSVFYGFSNVITITIKGNLNTVGNYAFYSCSDLETINHQGTKVPGGSNARIKEGVTINVPAGYNSNTFGGSPVTKPHTHTWNYSVNRTTITATCSDWSCRQAGGSVTISAPSDLIYDGNDKNATLAFSRDWALDEAAKPDITYNSVNRTNVTGSEISASISLGGKTASVRYTIAPKDLTDEQVEIALEKDQYGYTGEYIKPAVISVKLNGQPLNSGDYSVGYANNKNASDKAEVIVTFQGNYSGEARKTFTIEKAKGEINLIAPVESVLPGTTILLTVESNAENFENLEFSGEGFEIVGEAVEIEGGWKIKTKIDEDLVIGENDKVNICVAYKDTAIYTGNDELSLKVGMSGSSVDEEALKALKDDIDELRNLIAKKADAKEIAEQLKAITEQIAKLDASHATKAELKNAEEKLNKAIDNLEAELKQQLKDEIDAVGALIAGLDERVDDAEAAIAGLKEAIVGLKAADENNAADLQKAITDLNAAIEAAKVAATAADNALKQELNNAIAAAKNELDGKIAQVQENLDNAVATLNAAIDTKADEATVNAAIADLQNAINALEAVKDNYVAADTALKTELKGEIDAAKSLIEGLTDRVALAEDAIIALQRAIAGLTAADEKNAADLQKAITDLNAAIDAAKDAATAADNALKQELNGAIDDAKDALEDKIAKVQENLDDAVITLNAAIDTKADKATVDAAIANLQNAIDALEAAKDNYVAADAALKEELEAAIKAATDRITALDNKIGNVQTDLDATKRKLDEEITKLTNAIAAGDQELSAKINNLTIALEAAKQSLEAADAELKAKIENAQKALQMAIDAVQANLNEAKENLAKAIAAGDKELDGKISDLNKALKAMDAAYKAADENLKKQLETEIKAANDLIDSLEFRMDTAEDAIAVLDKAVEELKKVDAANAAAMKAAIENLNKAIKGVKEFAEKSDAETKAALNEKINAAQTALEAKIAEIQANLDKAVEELKAADQANAEKLADAIARLKEAIAVAEAASAAADAVQDEHIIALKNEINRVAIDLEKAQANLEAALKAEIEALTSELKRAEEALKNAIDTKADEDAVNAAIAELQNEIAALEAAKNNYIAADAALKAEVEAAIAKAKQEAIEAAKGHIPYIGENGNWWIGNSDTGVDANGIQGETGKDGITPQLRVGSGNTWEVSYDNGKTWTSLGVSAVGASGSNGRNGRDGKDGVDGKDGITPQLRINEDTNMWEISYDEGKTWESLGVVATGSDGADGANGADGITPQLRINEKTNMWEVSYDEGATWTSMGVKATGADGSSNVLPLVISGISLAGMIAMICIMLVDRKKRGLPVG